MEAGRLVALLKDSLRVVLLSLGLALAFAAAAQRPGSALSLRAEWSLAAKGVLEAGLLWQQERRRRHLSPHSQKQRGADAQYFEALANDQNAETRS